MHGTCQGYCVCAKFAAKMRTNSTVPRSFNSHKLAEILHYLALLGAISSLVKRDEAYEQPCC